MSAALLEGKSLARRMRESLAPRIAAAARALGREPSLSIIAAEGDPVVASYLKSKLKAFGPAGIAAAVHGLPRGQEGIAALVGRLEADPAVDGIIVLRPFPEGVDARALSMVIPASKDAEGMSPVNFGETFLAKTYEQAASGILPCTAFATVELLRSSGFDAAGKSAVVVGRSNILGKPAAHLLGTLDATVTLCHSRTPDLRERLAGADIVVACLGRPRFVQGAWLKQGAVVLDAGMNSDGGVLCGDVDFASACERASLITPVPGGVGPVTTAVLLSNVVRLAERTAGSH